MSSPRASRHSLVVTYLHRSVSISGFDHVQLSSSR
jgi:hypothetical protein